MQQEIIKSARSFLGTPFVHQGRSECGVDCLGLLILISKTLNLRSRNGELLHECDILTYSRTPDADLLYQTLKNCLNETDKPQLGAVALLNIADNPQHLGIIGDYIAGGFSLIHAYQTAGKVIENNFDISWQRRSVSFFLL
jgi:hypothetical protein